MSPQAILFVDHGTTQQSANDDGAKLVVSTDPARAGLGELAPSAQSGRLYLAVFAGAKRTGGFAVEVDGVARDGDRIVVHARFTEPAADAMVIQVLTSPAHLVSVDLSRTSGVSEAALVDQRGAVVARTAVAQSPP